MRTSEFGADPLKTSGLLVDTNVLVLYAVGTVNRRQIETFKRTRKYTAQDYDLLLRVLGEFRSLYSVAHVLAEVSNLTDLPDSYRRQALEVLKQTISILEEPAIPSLQAAQENSYPALGLTDAAIVAIAREHNCTVLTDDLDLYRWLSHDRI